MPFPNVPDKHDADPVVTPERQADYRDEQADGEVVEPPAGVVVTYSRDLLAYVREAYDGHVVDQYYGDLYVLDGTDGRVGVLGDFGVGAPIAAMHVEELARDGTAAFLSVGFAGCLDPGVEMGEFLVPDRAVRDEGTSHHYAPSEKHAHPSDDLFAATTALLDEREAPYRVGGTWTTDAVYRETAREVEQYASEGVLTVEMEAAAVFAVAAHRGVDAGAMFVASDYLTPEDWEPEFHRTTEDMQRLLDASVDVLARYVD